MGSAENLEAYNARMNNIRRGHNGIYAQREDLNAAIETMSKGAHAFDAALAPLAVTGGVPREVEQAQHAAEAAIEGLRRTLEPYQTTFPA